LALPATLAWRDAELSFHEHLCFHNLPSRVLKRALRLQGGTTKVDFQGTDLRARSGEAKVEGKRRTLRLTPNSEHEGHQVGLNFN
jgi:hypothetical protein